MNRRIWKYEIPAKGLEVTLDEPRVLFVGADPEGVSDFPFVWIEHGESGGADDDEASTLRFKIIMTGEDTPDGMGHVGSHIVKEKVMHVYMSTNAQTTRRNR